MKFINRPIILIFGSRESVGKNLDKFEDSNTRVDASETSRIILENYFSFIIIIIVIIRGCNLDRIAIFVVIVVDRIWTKHG